MSAGYASASHAAGSASDIAPRKVVVIRMEHAEGLTNSEYRFGDLIQKMFKFRHDLLKVKVHWESSAEPPVCTTHVELHDGKCNIDQTMILEVPRDAKKLIFRAYREVGILQDAFRGDPLYGVGAIEVQDDGAERQHKISLRDPGPGSISISIKTEMRELREMSLCLHGGPFGDGPCNHWGLGLTKPGESDGFVYEIGNPRFPNKGPVCVHGPKGIVAHSVPQDDTEFWQKLLNERKEQGLIPDWGLLRLQSRESIPTDAICKMLPGRRISDFQTAVYPVGNTFFCEAELEGFVKEYLQLNPEYHCVHNSCQVFARDLHSFLSCGRVFGNYTDQEFLRTWVGWSAFTLGLDR